MKTFSNEIKEMANKAIFVGTLNDLYEAGLMTGGIIIEDGMITGIELEEEC